MKLNKSFYAVFNIFILTVIALLAFTLLNEEYLFQWTAHNWEFYLILCAIVLLLLLLNKQLVSLLMTIGITSGIFIGNYLGGSIKRFNEENIIESMRPEEVYRLRHHPGFEIWIGIIILSILIGIVLQNVIEKKIQINQ